MAYKTRQELLEEHAEWRQSLGSLYDRAADALDLEAEAKGDPEEGQG